MHDPPLVNDPFRSATGRVGDVILRRPEMREVCDCVQVALAEFTDPAAMSDRQNSGKAEEGKPG
jgi:hypothetical protein